MSEPTTKESNPKDAIGCKKPPLSVLPAPAMYVAALALLDGACKYRRHNWRIAGVRASIYYDAVMRHLTRCWEGEDTDPESGIPHLGHAMACLIILLDSRLAGKLTDDRPPALDPSWMKDIQSAVTQLLSRHPNPKTPFTINDKPAS